MPPQNIYGFARRSPSSAANDPLVGMADLPRLGICFHPNHLRRLWTRGEFPRPFKLSARKLVWKRSEIIEWVESKRREAADENPRAGDA